MEKNNDVATIITTETTPEEPEKKILKNFDIDSFQKYVLGYKKNGSPRAIYDVFRDYQKMRKKKKKKSKSSDDEYVMYFPSLLKDKSKKKKKKKK